MSMSFSLFSVIFFLLVHNSKINGENDSTDAKEIYANNLTNIIDRFRKLWPVQEWKKLGYFTDEYLLNINKHWLQFGPPEKFHFVILGTIYGVIMVCGSIGNLLVMFLFVKCKPLRTPANTLIFNLAVSEVLIVAEAPIFIYNCYYQGPALGEIACRLYGFMGGLGGTVSIMTLSAISFDRYFVVQFPLHQIYSTLRLKICLLVIWLYGIVFSVIPALDIGLGRYTYEGYLTSCSFDYLTDDRMERGFIVVFCIAAWVIPLALIIFSYSNIIKVVVVREKKSDQKGRDSFRHLKEEVSKKQELKLAFLVFFSICLWFLSWTPYTIISVIGLCNKQLITPTVSMIPALFCKTTSCINPFVYALSHPKFKTELKKIFCCFMNNRRESGKIWTTHAVQQQVDFKSDKEPSEVAVMVEIDLRSSTYTWQTAGNNKGREELKDAERKFKRQSSKMKILCLQPTFSNKSSIFRKVTRRLSGREKERKRKESY